MSQKTYVMYFYKNFIFSLMKSSISTFCVDLRLLLSSNRMLPVEEKTIPDETFDAGIAKKCFAHLYKNGNFALPISCHHLSVDSN
jgi:hypothetical protein